MKTDFLIAKREGLTQRVSDLQATITKDERGFTAEERQQFDDAVAEIRGIDDTLRSVDAHLAAEVAAAQTAKASRSGQPGQPDLPPTTQLRAARASSTPEYAQAFLSLMRTGRVPVELRAHTVATDTAGGYLVPDLWHSEIISKLRDVNVMRQYATVLTTSKGDLNIPRETSTGTANWTGEGVAYNESEDVFGNVAFSPWKLTRLVKVSEELAADEDFDLMAYLAKTFAWSFADKEEAAFVNGDGTSKPRGILLDSTAGTTAAATNAVTFDEVQNLYFSVKPAYRANGTWIMNDATRAYLSKIKTGVASDVRYLWQESLGGGPTPTLMGRPVISSTNMPTIAASAKTIAFGDLSFYYIVDKAGMTLTRLNELYAATGLIGFIANKRTDGELMQAEAVKHLVQA